MKNRLRMIFDRFWRVSDDFDYEVLLDRREKPFEFLVPDFEEAAINRAYLYDNTTWYHTEFVKKCKNLVIIEPDAAHCIVGLNKVLSSSIFSEEPLPSLPRYILSFFKTRKKIQKAILFDGKVGVNYFYLFSEVISKMYLLPVIEGYKQLPLIISRKVFDSKNFQYIYAQTELKNFNWVIQEEGEYIKVEELYLIRSMPYEKKYLNGISAILTGKGQDSESVKKDRNIFLNRSSKVGRYIENFDEIKPLLDKYQFEIIDTDNTTLDFQVKLFSSARNFIGIHGAGNVNIIFSDQQLRFIEINPGNRISCQFYWLAKTLQIAYYDVVMGGNLTAEPGKKEKGFYVDPVKLEKVIVKMLEVI